MALLDLLTCTYTSDIAAGGNGQGVYENYKFRLKAGLEDCWLGGYSTRVNEPCACPSTLFSPRYLSAKLPAKIAGTDTLSCATVKFVLPTPEPSFVELAVRNLKNCGAICIDLVGEKWSNIPPKLIPYTPDTRKVYRLARASNNIKVTGIMEYNSDAFGTVDIGIRPYEADPIDLTGASVSGTTGLAVPGQPFADCHGPLQPSVPCATQGITPRAAIVKAVGNANGTITEPVSQLSRLVPINAKRADAIICLQLLGLKSICLGYQGESVKNIHEFFN